MAQLTFLERLRHWIGGICFQIYLWSIDQTEEDFWQEQELQARRDQFSEDSIRRIVIDPKFHYQYINDMPTHNLVSFFYVGLTKHNQNPADIFEALCYTAKMIQSEKDQHGS